MDFENSGVAAHERFAVTAQGLAHPKRLQLLTLLAQAERSVEALANAAELPVATTSAQLQKLRRSGLVARRREGTRIHYSLAGPHVLDLLLALQEVTRRQHVDAHLAPAGPSDDVPVRAIDRDELLRDVESGQLVVLDVRPVEEFRAAHIPGALSVPLDELERRLDNVPDGVEVVAYCRGAHCVLSDDAVRLLRERGRRASVLDHGMLEWRAAGAPLGVGR